MILYIDEFQEISQMPELTDDVIEAVVSAGAFALRWNAEEECFEDYDGKNWVKVINYADARM